MLQEIRELGFEYAELSHGVRISLLPGILEAVDAGEIKISSLHNFCPLPMGVDRAAPNIFKFSSDNQRERDNAYRHTLKTLETAIRVQASLVVLHLGAIDMKDYTDKLIELVEAGKKDTPKYQKLCEEVIYKREEKKDKYIKLAHDVLRRLVAEAEPRGIKLGIENREALEEIPLEPDYPFFFLEFESPSIVYWHDTGHAQIKQHLGFIDHVEHLATLQHRLHGFHIHDVQFPARDHCPPGSGTIDFAALQPMVKPEHLKVFEFSPGMSPEAALKGIAHVKAIWGEE